MEVLGRSAVLGSIPTTSNSWRCRTWSAAIPDSTRPCSRRLGRKRSGTRTCARSMVSDEGRGRMVAARETCLPNFAMLAGSTRCWSSSIQARSDLSSHLGRDCSSLLVRRTCESTATAGRRDGRPGAGVNLVGSRARRALQWPSRHTAKSLRSGRKTVVARRRSCSKNRRGCSYRSWSCWYPGLSVVLAVRGPSCGCVCTPNE